MSSTGGSSHTNPFPGLRPFQEDEQHLFFGRESQVDAMVDKLAHNRFLAVVGTSGSGKSSLVNCGLRPALHAGLMASAGTAWRMAQMRPGGDPLISLSRALAEEGVLFAEHQADVLSLEEIVDTTLRMSKLGLVDIVEQAHLADGVNLLLVVDQFEELFRYRHLGADSSMSVVMAEQAVAFVNLLLAAIEQSNLPIYVVLTMRSDFLGDCAQFPGLAEAINSGQYLVPRMSREQRRAAISGPIGVGGARIDPVLLTRLVNDVGDNPDQLSILQHALNRTWAYWENVTGRKGMLDLECYESVGSMTRALDRHADKAYAELADAEQQRICEVVFKALTDKATDSRGVRRPTTFQTLCALADATADQVTAVIDIFRKPSRSFLMPPAGTPLNPETVVDISHESLMRVWQRLDSWADLEADSARTYRRLAETSALFQKTNDLLRNPDLTVALQWRKRNKPNATWAERYNPAFSDAMRFLKKSEKSDLRRKHIRAGVLGAVVCIPVGIAAYKMLDAVSDAKQHVDVAESKLALTETKVNLLKLANEETRQVVVEQERLISSAEVEEDREELDTATWYLNDADRETLKNYINSLNSEKRSAQHELTELNALYQANSIDKKALEAQISLLSEDDQKIIEKYRNVISPELPSVITKKYALQQAQSLDQENAELDAVMAQLNDKNKLIVEKQINNLKRDRVNAQQEILKRKTSIEKLASEISLLTDVVAQLDVPDALVEAIVDESENDESPAADLSLEATTPGNQPVALKVEAALPANSQTVIEAASIEPANDSASGALTESTTILSYFVVCENVTQLEPQNCSDVVDVFRPGRVYVFARVITQQQEETLTLKWLELESGKLIVDKLLTVNHNPQGYRTYSWKTFNSGLYQACIYDQGGNKIDCVNFKVSDPETSELQNDQLAKNENDGQTGSDVEQTKFASLENVDTAPLPRKQTTEQSQVPNVPAQLQAPVVTTQTRTEPEVEPEPQLAADSKPDLATRLENSNGDGLVVCANVDNLEPEGCSGILAPGKVFVFARVISHLQSEELTLNWSRNGTPISSKTLTVEKNSHGFRIYSWKTLNSGSYQACLLDQNGSEIGCRQFLVE